MSPTSESGGATTQAGVYFQNCIAVLRMAAMLKRVELGDDSSLGRIISVRIEAPVEVDDILVTFSGGAKEYIQAKMAVGPASEEWITMWASFYRQYESVRSHGPSVKDVITLAVKWSPRMSELETLLARARASTSEAEWMGDRLTKSQRGLVEGIKGSLGKKKITPNDTDLLQFCRTVSVWLLSFDGDPRGTDTFEREVLQILDNSVVPSKNIFQVLMELASNLARERKELTYEELVRVVNQKGFMTPTDAPAKAMTLTAGQSARARQDLEALKKQWEIQRRMLSAVREAYYKLPMSQPEEREALKIRIEERESELAQLEERIEAQEADLG
jgi:hypothetical protein